MNRMSMMGLIASLKLFKSFDKNDGCILFSHLNTLKLKFYISEQNKFSP